MRDGHDGGPRSGRGLRGVCRGDRWVGLEMGVGAQAWGGFPWDSLEENSNVLPLAGRSVHEWAWGMSQTRFKRRQRDHPATWFLFPCNRWFLFGFLCVFPCQSTTGFPSLKLHSVELSPSPDFDLAPSLTIAKDFELL